MWKHLTLALLLAGGAVGCKANNKAAPGATASGSATGTTRAPVAGQPGRSGKFNFTPMRGGMIPRNGLSGGGDPDEALDMSDQDRALRRAERMAKMDTDGDGTISDAERDASRKQRAEEMLAKLDTNKDGTISDDERAAALKQRADTLRTKLDTDGDGKLTVSEMESSRFNRLDPASLDTNKDGVISTEELQAGIPTRPRFDAAQGMGGPMRDGRMGAGAGSGSGG